MIFTLVFLILAGCLITDFYLLLREGDEGKDLFVKCFFVGGVCLVILCGMLPIAWERMP